MLDVRPDSPGNPYRRARLARLRALVEEVLARQPLCRIVDIGGTSGFWRLWLAELPAGQVRVDCYNLDPSHADAGQVENVRVMRGDATDLSQVADGAYDIAFSNSVIEHVGLWRAQRAMAREVKRVAPVYFVQTPYFWFPVEPHARAPFLHWLPESWAYRILMRRRLGFWPKQGTVAEAVEMLQSARMLDGAQFRALFDDAEIIREKAFGLTKSLMAIRRSHPR